MRKIKNIAFADIRPFVRYVQELPISPGNYPVFMVAQLLPTILCEQWVWKTVH